MTLQHALIVAVVVLAGVVSALWIVVVREMRDCRADRRRFISYIIEHQPNVCGAKRCPDRLTTPLPENFQPKPT